ncbi:hypothetical protein [Nocardia coubleae]|uniref:Uncharacterized protein n=1 Tax=Nocardia coubleae TaxID=356147 RepID=A0A846W427_9NOCA|nr:hypothetical protein [Nocardia coubleae]NKX87931.1 hypothetical protein [Nocardia coubleae]
MNVHDPMAEVERALAARVGWNRLDDHLIYACEMLSRRSDPIYLPEGQTRSVSHSDHLRSPET